MKPYFTIVVLFCSIQLCFGQSYLGRNEVQNFFFPEFSLDSLEGQITESERLELLTKICYSENHCDFCMADSTILNATFDEYLMEHENSIYFIDLDKDGDLDIIFNGKECSGIETGIVEFYENTGDTLIRHFKIEGRIVNLDIINSTFSVHDYPCCAQQTHYIVKYEYDKNTFNHKIVEAVSFVGHSHILGGNYFPKSIEKYERFKTKLNTPLRWSPNTNSFDPTNTCKNDRTNIIYTFPKGTKGVILHENENDWCFVKMSPSSFSINSCQDNYIKDLPQSMVCYYGWMKLE